MQKAQDSAQNRTGNRRGAGPPRPAMERGLAPPDRCRQEGRTGARETRLEPENPRRDLCGGPAPKRNVGGAISRYTSVFKRANTQPQSRIARQTIEYTTKWIKCP